MYVEIYKLIIRFCFIRFQYSALEQQYVVESLQASRTQSNRGLNKILLQQSGSCSQPQSSFSAPSSSNTSPTAVPQQANLISDSPAHSLSGEVRKKHRVRINPLTSSVSVTPSLKPQQKSKW